MSDFTAKKCIPLQEVGGNGGGAFESYKEDGSLISKIEAWADDNRMRGIKIYYANSREGYNESNESFMFGKAGGSHFEFTFQPGELITELSIWNTKWKDHTYVGAFRIETSLGNVFYPKERTSSHKEFKLEVGYGAAVGIAGKAGNALDKLGFYLIKDARKLQFTDVIYSEQYLPQPTEVEITEITYTNNSSVDQHYEYSYSYTEYDAYSWEINSGFSESYSLTITAEVPELGLGAEGSAEWTKSIETVHASESSTSKTITSTYPVEVPANSTVSVDINYFTGKCQTVYTGLVTLTLEGGTETFAYYTAGEYQGGNSTDIQVTVTETSLITQESTTEVSVV